jgi:F1F0 ATPase subunit 2
LLAGAIFYGGLWWTVQRLQEASSPALLVIGSLFVRLVLAMAIFYGIMAAGGELLYLGIALVVFLIVRMVMVGRIRPQGGRHAVKS